MNVIFKAVSQGAIFALVFGLQLGCGSIIHGTHQDVKFTTEPAGATIRLDNGTVLTSPASAELERDEDYVVSISKEGYQTAVVPLNSVLSGWLAGNILFGGIIGGGVDLATGAAYTLTPENVVITLTPLRPGEVDAGPASGKLTTQQKLDALESLRAQGVVNEKEYEASKKRLNEDLKKEITQGS